ncbi:MAG: Alpha/Beta hydrolase protein [Monoraphidium minutum]|nr:MAG: Alpha/Beta hydrolase protein [Monoraphidium minutum]
MRLARAAAGPRPSTTAARARAPRAAPAPPRAARSRAMAAAGPKQAPLGDWASPISSELITSRTLGLASPTVLADGTVTWAELRPSEGGRNVIVARPPGGAAADVSPAPDSGVNVRTRVHEYGGGEHLVLPDGRLVFTNFSDQRVYVQPLAGGAPPALLTAEGSGQRFADYCWDSTRNRLLAVCEDHSDSSKEAVNFLAAVDLASGAVARLAGGRDFYAAPRLSRDGGRVAWVQWDHPAMPWDATQLVVADVLLDGTLGEHRVVAGGAAEAPQQPQWAEDGSLYFVTDKEEWWNLYRMAPSGEVTPVLPMAAEFGSPPWTLGLRTYAPLPTSDPSRPMLLAGYSDPKAAGANLGVVDVAASRLHPLDCGLTATRGGYQISVSEVGGDLAVAVAAGSPTRANAVMMLKAKGVEGLMASKPGDWEVVKASTDMELDAGYLSSPTAVEFPTTGGRTAYMNFYPPNNKDFELPPGQLPALLVKIHGGPTSSASTLLNFSYQFWTSRGYAIADVNYGGSTGFGRTYRERLKGNWGIVDVDDCCNAARHLAAQGLVDEKRLCIDGGSAGGYTTLACLAFRDVFSAGASHYGVADAELLAAHTHKFESRYLDGLMGPYPAAKAVYVERSPIHAAANIKAPVALFQGDEDKVVPPEQAEVMHRALLGNGLPTALVMYKGEQHGFRSAAAIRSALEGEWYFYGKVLGFNAAYSPDLQPITIDNLPAPAATAQ